MGRSLSSGTGERTGGRGRSNGGNRMSGTLADLTSNDKPLRTVLRFNKNKGLDQVYASLVHFSESRQMKTLDIDLQELRYELAIEGMNPLVFFPKMVDEILTMVSGESERFKKILPKKQEGQETYSLAQVREFGNGYFIHDHNTIHIKRQGALWLMRYIGLKASEHGYRWNGKKWVKHPLEKKS